jgi:hypothetical protein
MASTFTSNLRLTLLEDLSNKNVWGRIINNAVVTLAERALTGVIDIDISAGNVTCSEVDGGEDQSRYMIFRAVGSAAGERTIYLPDLSKPVFLKNSSNVDVILQMITATSGGLRVSPGEFSGGVVLASQNVLRAFENGLSPVVERTSGYASLDIPSTTVGCLADVRYQIEGNFVFGQLTLKSIQQQSTGTITLDTSPTLVASVTPVVTYQFPILINESGTVRESILAVPAAGADWTISRVSGTFGATTTRETVEPQVFCYPLV